MSQFYVLRIGHRPERDKRVTTHVALTARAFGASKMYLSRPDSRIVKTINDVVKKFGGNFSVETVSNPKKIAKEWKGKVIHLTMFGLPFRDFIEELKVEASSILFVVGSEKVPPCSVRFRKVPQGSVRLRRLREIPQGFARFRHLPHGPA